MKKFYEAFLTPTRIEFSDGYMQTLAPTVDAQGRTTYHAEFTGSIKELTEKEKEAIRPGSEKLMKRIEEDVFAAVLAEMTKRST